VPGPVVPEWVRRPAGNVWRVGDVHARAVGHAGSVPGRAGTGHQCFRGTVKAMAERQQIPIYQFNHQERKDDVANRMRQQRGVRDGIVFIGVAQEKAQAFQGRKINGEFEFTRDKTVYVNHYYLH
jgi:predicted oxidoreductase